jgi:hypothetical protein
MNHKNQSSDKKYMLYLPTEQELKNEIISAIGEGKELADKAFKIAQESVNQK